MKLFWSATYFYDIIQLVKIVGDHYVMKKLGEICEWWEAAWRGVARQQGLGLGQAGSALPCPNM